MSISSDLAFYGSKSTAVADGEAGHDGHGGYRSSDELISLQTIPPNLLAGVAINKVAGKCGAGLGLLTYVHAGQTLAWRAPGDTNGTPVAIGAGGQFILSSNAGGDFYIVVTITAVDLPTSDITETIQIRPVNNTLMDDVDSNEALAGLTNYRAIFLKNNGAGALSNLFPIFDTGLASTVVLSDSDYGPSGGIDINVKNASTWPMSGFMRNITSGGEIIYYSERRGNRLIAGPSGRRRRDTSMWAGMPGDILEPIGPVDIALELPVSNKLSIILDDTAPPPATVQFFHPTVAYPAQGDFVIPSLAAGAYVGIWMRRQTPLNTPELLRQNIRLLFRWN